MQESKEVALPSGAKLRITLVPFADAKELWMTLLDEARGLKLDPNAEVDVNLFKDIFCMGFSSRKLETAVNKCFERCTYNDVKIDKSTFEPVAAREDYLSVQFEVVKENIAPFTKNLSAALSGIHAALKINPA